MLQHSTEAWVVDAGHIFARERVEIIPSKFKGVSCHMHTHVQFKTVV